VGHVAICRDRTVGVVPEPASAALLLCGVTMLGLHRRRN